MPVPVRRTLAVVAALLATAVVGLRWQLSVDPAEKNALAAIARTCPDQLLPGPAAPLASRA